MNIYRYQINSHDNFFIKPYAKSGCHLYYNNYCLGFYLTPQAAADDVYKFSTGCDEWDNLEGITEPPYDLKEWQIVYMHLPFF